MTPDLLRKIIAAQTEIASQGFNLGDVAMVAAQKAQDLTEADGATIELADGGDMVYQAVSGSLANFLGLRLALGSSLSGLCVREGKSQRCDDSETDERVNKEACRKVGLRSMLIVPLIFRDNTVGVLKVASSKVRCFEDEDINVLELIASSLAAAMHYAITHESGELYHQAMHDSLTGCGNRAYLYDKGRQALQHSSSSGSLFNVLLMDMNGLKGINDTFGHHLGDAAIKEVARRICATVRRSDVVARIGGDEFSVLVFDYANKDELDQLVIRLGEVISSPFVAEGKALDLSVSIGVASFPGEGRSLDELLQSADQSMYENKRAWKLRNPNAGRAA